MFGADELVYNYEMKGGEMRKKIIKKACLTTVIPSGFAMILWQPLKPFSLVLLFPLFGLSMIGVVLLIIGLVLPSDGDLSSDPDNEDLNSNQKGKRG